MNAYNQGFIDKCAELGINASELIKHLIATADKPKFKLPTQLKLPPSREPRYIGASKGYSEPQGPIPRPNVPEESFSGYK